MPGKSLYNFFFLYGGQDWINSTPTSHRDESCLSFINVILLIYPSHVQPRSFFPSWALSFAYKPLLRFPSLSFYFFILFYFFSFSLSLSLFCLLFSLSSSLFSLFLLLFTLSMENQKRHEQLPSSSAARRSLKRKFDEDFEDDRRIDDVSTGDVNQDLVREVRTQVEILDSTFSAIEADRASAKRATQILSELAKNGSAKIVELLFIYLFF